ncbi:MAG: hypothetical protein R3E08_06835 [Thiotrichaceae bacterium]
MPLYARTPRRTIDHYDPKQRLVGGIVLCLIIVLIYFIFKMLIGLSAPAAHDGRYKLASAREDEESRLLHRRKLHIELWEMMASAR